jgi:signal transduction histidine kinase
VLNIVTNAVDAAEGVEDARVTVATEWNAASSTACVVVQDNGVGIDGNALDSIFQVFESTKGARGTGLGLPVSQKIVREHGGKIVVASAVGHGSTFTIELPMRRPESKPGGTGEGPTLGV